MFSTPAATIDPNEVCTKMDMQDFSKSAREVFLRQLFKYILNVDEPKQQWLDNWLEATADCSNTSEILDLFGKSKAVRDKKANEADSYTRWPSGHFYSPVVSRKAATNDWAKVSQRTPGLGIDLNVEGQRDFFSHLAPHIDRFPFPITKKPEFRYYEQNPSYSFGDASVYWAMLNVLQPKRIIEVGSGFSSALALDTIDALGLDTRCTFVDPFPEVARACTEPMDERHSILPERVQDITPTIVDELGHNDILFIDSSHVVKFGSDVHFEITQLLPRLQPGVIVHFHDIFWPFEYHRNWVTERNHSWNEIYFIQSFLLFNTSFRIEFFNHYFAKEQAGSLAILAPEVCAKLQVNPGGGFWIRRIQ